MEKVQNVRPSVVQQPKTPLIGRVEKGEVKIVPGQESNLASYLRYQMLKS